MFRSRFRVCVATLAMLASASFVCAQENSPAAEGPEQNASPRLVLKTDEAFVHFAPWAPLREARWDWSPYGELYLTQRDDGSMVRLLSAGVEGLPTRRAKYIETRIEGVGFERDRLIVLLTQRMTWDRPPSYPPRPDRNRGAGDAADDSPRNWSVHIFSLADGKFLKSRPIEENDAEDLRRAIVLPGEIPKALTAEQVASALELFPEERTEPQPPTP